MIREQQSITAPRVSIFARMRNNFLAGIVAIAPVALTIWLIWTVIGWIDSWVLPLIPDRFTPEQLIGIELHGLGVIIFLVSTFVIGVTAKGYVGRSLIRFGEKLVAKMPIVRSIYNAVKQIAETIFTQQDSSFDNTCLIEYPRKGVWAIGLIATATKGEVASRVPVQDEIVTVFMPTTPNPTSGFLLFMPKSDVVILDMSIEDAAKLVISAGLVYPKDSEKTSEQVIPVTCSPVMPQS